MGGCKDKHFRDMLCAYEIGMLSDEKQRALELHLLECEHCYQDAQNFKEAAQILKYDLGVRQFVAETVANESEATGDISKKPWTRLRRRRFRLALIPAALAAAAVILVLVFRPWQIEIRPTQDAVAVENRLAVMYFENLADPEDTNRLGEIAANLLITDLSESHYIQVVSSQRIFDILRSMGLEDSKILNRHIASQVAREARAEWMLVGNILQVKPQLALTAQLVDLHTGNTITAQRIVGTEGEDIFAVIDKLSSQIRKHLSLPAAAQLEPDPLVADVTTRSPEAYRHYLEGIDYYNKCYFMEARLSFERALEFDSTFAMVYYYLSLLKNADLIEKAAEYANNAGQKEKMYIRSLQARLHGDTTKIRSELQRIIERYPDEKDAHYLLGGYYFGRRNYEDAIRYYRKAVEIDSMFKLPFNQLAYAYDRLGDFDHAIWAINKYISFAPNEANPYDSRGEIYAKNGELDLAIESYQKALEIKPDYMTSLMYLGFLSVFKGEYARAESCLQEFTLKSGKTARAAGRLYLSFIPARQGKFEQALAVLDDGIGADRLEFPDPMVKRSHALKYLLQVIIHAEMNNFGTAFEVFEKNLQTADGKMPEWGVDYQHYYIQLLAQRGRYAQAREVAEELKYSLDKYRKTSEPYYYAMGSIELAEGNPEAALTHFAKATKPEKEFPSEFMLAQAYLKSGQTEEAITRFEKLLLHYSSPRTFWSIWSVKIHYFLGLAYEQSAQYNQAIQQYESFLEIWQNADPGIPEVKDARIRLARLQDMG